MPRKRRRRLFRDPGLLRRRALRRVPAPLSTLPAFRRAYRQLRPLMLQPLTRDRPSAGFLPVPCADHNFRFFVPTGEIRKTEVHASESENVTVPFSVSLLAAASAATNPGVQ